MRTGGLVGFDRIAWFNGGLFDDAGALPLDADDIRGLIAAARLDWSEVEPAILGTLFERGLDPAKRSQLGAHHTDRGKIPGPRRAAGCARRRGWRRSLWYLPAGSWLVWLWGLRSSENEKGRALITRPGSGSSGTRLPTAA